MNHAPRALRKVTGEMLAELGATDAQERGYQTAWDEANRSPSAPLPCPVCYMKGHIERIASLPNASEHVSQGKCESCKTYFQYPDG